MGLSLWLAIAFASDDMDEFDELRDGFKKSGSGEKVFVCWVRHDVVGKRVIPETGVACHQPRRGLHNHDESDDRLTSPLDLGSPECITGGGKGAGNNSARPHEHGRSLGPNTSQVGAC